MGTFGFGLIGLGAVSGLHAQAIKQARGAELRVACDVDEKRARAFAEANGCDWVTDRAKLLCRGDVQVVDVTTWSGTHAAIGAECARASKHVLVTKPIDVRLEAIDELLAECAAHNVRCAALHQSRSFEAYKQIKEAIDQGRLGRVYMGNAYCKWLRTQGYYDSAAWRGTFELDGGGCLMNQGVHSIDALLWFMGEVVSVAGHVDTLARRIEVEDCAVASLRFSSGALGTIQGATCMYEGFPARVEVHGERGDVAVQNDQIVLWNVQGEDIIRRESVGASGAADPASGYAHALGAHVEQIEDLLAAIREDREPALSGREARRAVEVILAIYRSSRLGQVVRLPLEGNSDPRLLAPGR